MILMEEYMNNYSAIMLNKIHTHLPGKIISFDPEKMEATVQSLARVKIGDVEITPQEIERCPVCYTNGTNFAIRNPLKAGDLVWLGFSEVSLEKILSSKNPESVVTNNKFDLTDAVVVATMDSESDTMPSSNTNDLLILNKLTGDKIVFKEDGSIETTSKQIDAPNATINCKKLVATDDVLAGSISLKNHTHKYSPGSGTPVPSDKPE
ncbi:MAG: Gp138 family membrane-puncturing spike protein [Aeromonas sp.]